MVVRWQGWQIASRGNPRCDFTLEIGCPPIGMHPEAIDQQIAQNSLRALFTFIPSDKKDKADSALPVWLSAWLVTVNCCSWSSSGYSCGRVRLPNPVECFRIQSSLWIDRKRESTSGVGGNQRPLRCKPRPTVQYSVSLGSINLPL